jgi:ubiquinone biosynthesis protein
MLNPSFSLLEVMQPYRRTMVFQRFSPLRRLRKMRRIYWELSHLIDVVPRGIVEILEQVQTGKFDVHLDHRGLEPSVNRLVLGMLTSSLFLGSSWLLATGVEPVIGLGVFATKISVPGVLGSGLALALGLRLWRAISKSLGQRR